MSERVEWRVVCADGAAWHANSREEALTAAEYEDDNCLVCGPHRVQSRTVTTSEWVDADVNA